MSTSAFPLSRRVAFGAAFATFFALASASLAEVRLHPLFTDHAVLQQGRRVPVWGTADAGERIIVEFGKQQLVTTADEHGRWRVALSPLRATTNGLTLKASGKSQVAEVSDVVVGEVWIASGQSNMEFPLKPSFESAADIAASANPNLRLFTVVKRRSSVLKTDLDYAKHAWAVAGPDTTPGFSAVGYYFGRDLEAALRSQNVPVGIIHTSWGGSPAEVWMSEDALKSNHVYDRDIRDAYLPARRAYHAGVVQWEKDKAAAEAKGEKFTGNHPWAPWEPSELYNGMIANLIPYAIKGAIWYQGESNAGRAWQYRSLFADMITNWRKDWGQGDFYFYAVQLAPWDMNRKRDLATIAAQVGDSSWAELREAQNYVAKTLPNVGVAVITDVGDKDDIHPTKKAPVGNRLALLVRAKAYGQDVEYTGPVFTAKSTNGREVTMNFTHVGKGLKTADGSAPTGFTVAGEDGKFHAATAQIRGTSQIVLSSAEVEKPVAIRYGWADYPVVNLVNEAGLPASPFRTDTWELTTQAIR
ncbi:MAG TPA: sialate O-acetylesterase [Candidatus Limnocylindria bacterium]|nr:sialate O-acetylesterase [Candidatus Limnocylindria bacterium]